MALLTAPRSPLPCGLAAAVDGGRCRQPKRATVVWCSAIAVEASSLTSVSPIRWGSSKLQGRRSEMEDDLFLRSDGLDGFSFAAVFDGHAGFSSVEFLKEELYKECMLALQGGILLNSMNLNSAKEAIKRAFKRVDSNLLDWLEQTGKDIDSGATATVVLLKKNLLVISHVGDSSVVLSRMGKAQVLTNPHRPYGNNKVCLEEIKRIRAAGGWIVDGRICGDISVSRAFGDIRFKTKKDEMLAKGVEEGKWTEKFASRIKFKGDLVTASPDIYDLQLSPDTEFVILASDGLWDYMKSTEAVSFVREQLRQHGDVQQACEALGRAALDRYSADNISIVIAELGRTDWQNVPEYRPNIFLEITQAFATLGVVSLGIWLSSFLIL